MPNGKELLQELQCLVTGDHIDEEAYRRLLLTAMIGVLTKLDGMAENPLIYLGDVIRKHPKVFWFMVMLIILFFTLVDAREIIYDFAGLPIKLTPIP